MRPHVDLLSKFTSYKYFNVEVFVNDLTI